MKYKHISSEERYLIDCLFNKERKSISKIAQILGRHKSSISRELKRNTGIDYSKNNLAIYDCEIALCKATKRQEHKWFFHKDKYQDFIQAFKNNFENKYAGVKSTWYFLKKKYPNIKFPSWRQVYNWIRSRNWILKPSDRLRKYYVKGRKRKIGLFSKFKSKLVFPIWMRPKIIDKRIEFGHYEADFIIGKKESGFSNLITLTERCSRMTFIKKIQTKNPMKCNSVLYKMIKENNLNVKSITIDNGIEFEKIGLLASWIDAKIYFCEPYASYQRGSNEHVNGLVRRTWKKGTNFSLISDEEIDKIQNKINEMRREIFDWKSSKDVFNMLSK